MQVAERKCHLGYVEFDDFLFERSEPIKMETQVAAKHEVEDHKEVFIVLEGESQVTDEWRVNLLQQPSLLYDLGTSTVSNEHYATAALFQEGAHVVDCSLLRDSSLVNVLEGVQSLCLFVLNHTDL